MVPHRWLLVSSLVSLPIIACSFVIPWIASDSDPLQVVEVQPSLLKVEPPIDGRRTTCGAEFSVVNNESTPVTIESIQTSCGCTVAGPLDITELRPHQSVIVPLTISVPTGPEKRVRVSVHTTSLKRPKLVVELRIVGRSPSLPMIEFMHQEVHVTGTTAGEWVDQTLEFKTFEAESESNWLTGIAEIPGIQIKEWNCKTDGDVAGVPAHKTYRCVISVQIPDSIDRADVKLIELKTIDATESCPSFTITSKLYPLIRAVPPEIAIRLDEGQTLVRRRILLVSSQSWILPDLLPGSDAIDVTSEDINVESQNKKITVLIDALRVDTSQKAYKICIPTGNSQQPMVSIPVTIVRTGAGS